MSHDHAAPAHALYCSPLFTKSLAFAAARCEVVYVLSALHGLVELDRVIGPYNRKLSSASKAERQAWGQRVASSLIARHGRSARFLLLAGADYCRPLATGLRTHDGYRDGRWRGVDSSHINTPLAGMGLGERLRGSRNRTRSSSPRRPRDARA